MALLIASRHYYVSGAKYKETFKAGKKWTENPGAEDGKLKSETNYVDSLVEAFKTYFEMVRSIRGHHKAGKKRWTGNQLHIHQGPKTLKTYVNGDKRV